MLLPTGLYIAGGAVAVAVSFIVALLLPRKFFCRGQVENRVVSETQSPVWPSGLTLSLVIVLIVAGFIGSRDPLANPLPTMVWSVWWVGITILHAVFGNLWASMNPWRVVYRLLQKLGIARSTGYFECPVSLGYWPACILFIWFAWFELVYPAPVDPARLASVILAFGFINVTAMVLFGEKNWVKYGDPFAVYFRMVSWLSPFSETANASQRRLPCVSLINLPPMPVSGVAFVLLALSVVAFDGFSRTFTWMSWLNVNPLEYPGRSAILVQNTLALGLAFILFVAVYYVTVYCENKIHTNGRARSGYLVYSLVPIAFAYYFAHYLPFLLVDAQHAVRAMSDPFALGWNIFGTANLHVTASLLSHHHTVEIIWYVQVSIIVLGHVCAVFVARTLTVLNSSHNAGLFVVELPSTILMIAYTVLGLWLLSTPVVG